MELKKLVLSSTFLFFLIISQTVFAYPISGNAVKTEKTTISAGITPDSFLYFLDVALDNINLLLTFDPAEKAKKGLDIARERLMEVREMVKAGKIDASQIAQREHANVLNIVQSSIREIERDNSTQEIEEEIEIEKELEEHKTEVEEVEAELKIKIKVEGKITPEQQALLESILENLKEKITEVEIEIENEKNETKIKIKQETDKTDKEIEIEIEKLEERKGLKELRKEKAWDKIKDVEEEINETIEELSKLNITDGNISFALNILAQAKDAYALKNYKEAIRLAKEAEDQIEDYKEQFEIEIEEKEIEVEIEKNRAKVEVEIAGEEATFILDTTKKDEIVAEIASRTGLSISEVEDIIKFEIVEEIEGIEVEVEIEEGIAKIKTEINETESEFTLNTTEKEEIISEIVRKTGLSREQIEKSLEIEVEVEKEIEEKEKLEVE